LTKIAKTRQQDTRDTDAEYLFSRTRSVHLNDTADQ